MSLLYNIFLSLDAVIYNFIKYLFDIFLLLARTAIFSADESVSFVRRIYQIIGVIMLFMLSYELLKKIVSPDKDKESVGKVVFNVAKALILLALVPTIFSFAFKVQTAILDSNAIGKIILGTSSGNKTSGNSPAAIKKSGGITMSLSIIKSFLYPIGDGSTSSNAEDLVIVSGMTYKQICDQIESTGDFYKIQLFADKIDNNGVRNVMVYHWFISTIAGAFVVYLLVSYCLSLGFRVVKLAFYEIMAPVCIIASILPSQKEMLSKWIKATLTTFVESFLRVAIMFFGIYVIWLITNLLGPNNYYNTLGTKNIGSATLALVKAIIIMGVVTFIKQAPDLISKLTGIDSSAMNLGIKDQLAQGGLFTAGAVAGGAITSGVRNLTSKGGAIGEHASEFRKYRKGLKNASSPEEKANLKASYASRKKELRKNAWKSVPGMLASGLAGTVSGGAHSFNKDAKSFADMKEAASKGTKIAAEKRDKRASYRAQHGGIMGSVKGHVVDAIEGAKDFAGVGSVAALEAENKAYDQITSKTKAVKTAAEDFINGEAEKAGSKFSIQGVNSKGETVTFQTDKLRKLKQQYEFAKASGKIAGKSDEEFATALAEMQDAISEYTKDFANAVQSAAYSSDAAYNALSDKMKADLSAVRIAAVEAKAEISSNLHMKAVQDAGFTAQSVNAAAAWDTTDAEAAIRKMGDIIKVATSENTAKINEHARAKAQRESNKTKE